MPEAGKVELQRTGAHGQGHAEVAGKLDSQAHVLADGAEAHIGRSPGWRKRATPNRGNGPIERPAGAAALADGLLHLVDAQARLHAKREGFHRGDRADAVQQVVDEFHSGSRAGSAHVEDPLPDRLEHRPSPRQGRPVAANHHREPSLPALCHATADRRVENFHAKLGSFREMRRTTWGLMVLSST